MKTTLAVLLGVIGGIAVAVALAFGLHLAEDEDPEQREQAPAAQALDLATEACNTALAGGTGKASGLPALVEERNEAAAIAADAARLDEEWDQLAEQASTWAYTTHRATETIRELRDPSNVFDPTLSRDADRLLARLDPLKAALATECRAVQAAGGKVDDHLIDRF